MTAHDPTTAFLHLLAGDQTDGRYLEIRSRTPQGLRQEFFTTNRLDALHSRALWLGQRTDTYISVVARTSHSGKKHAVGESHLIWCEIDDPDASGRLAVARVKPTMTVESGIIRSPRSQADLAVADVRWRHVVNGSDVVNANRASTTNDMPVPDRVGACGSRWIPDACRDRQDRGSQDLALPSRTGTSGRSCAAALSSELRRSSSCCAVARAVVSVAAIPDPRFEVVQALHPQSPVLSGQTSQPRACPGSTERRYRSINGGGIDEH
jgi:hypothetical protein